MLLFSKCLVSRLKLFLARHSHRDACAKGDAETVNRHVNDEPGLAKKSTVDGETCLHLTAISNAFSISELMIKLGSDVNSRVTHSEVSNPSLIL